MNLVKMIETDDNVKWVSIDGFDQGTGRVFNCDEFGLTADDRVLDCDGCPLTRGDSLDIAVRNLAQW